jgi:hypothetical protein
VPRQFAHPVGWDESETNPSNRWSLQGTEAVSGCRLRSLKTSDDLDDYIRFHIAQERQRNYRMPSPELAA